MPGDAAQIVDGLPPKIVGLGIIGYPLARSIIVFVLVLTYPLPKLFAHPTLTVRNIQFANE